MGTFKTNRHGKLLFDRCSTIQFSLLSVYKDTVFGLGNVRERDHLGNPVVDGRIILRWIFRKWEEVVRTGWSWLRIGTGGGHL